MVRQELTFHVNFQIASSKEYYNDTLIEEIHYDEQGRIHDVYRKWYGNGNLSVMYTFLNGVVNGLCYNYYENGQVESESNYLDGKLNGIARKWHYNGQLEFELTYVNGYITSTFEKGVRQWL